MKNIVKFVLLMLFCLVTLFNCQKETLSSDISKEQEFSNVLDSKLKLLVSKENDALILSKKGENYVVTFEKNLLSFYYEPEVKSPNARILSCGSSVGTEVCSGDGLSFARCCRTSLDSGCTLTVYKGRDGNYHAKVAPQQ